MCGSVCEWVCLWVGVSAGGYVDRLCDYVNGSGVLNVPSSGSAQDAGGHQPGPKGGWEGKGWTGEWESVVYSCSVYCHTCRWSYMYTYIFVSVWGRGWEGDGKLWMMRI